MKVEQLGDAFAVYAVIALFIEENKITCAEAIYQSDLVIENAYSLIEQLCEIVGYHHEN